MSGMTEFEEGKLVNAVTQLHKDIEKLNMAVTRLNSRLAKQEIQLAKGKGMAAGVVALASIAGGLSSYIMGKI